MASSETDDFKVIAQAMADVERRLISPIGAEQRIKELEEALAPFALEAPFWGDASVCPDHAKFVLVGGEDGETNFTIGDLRRAAEVLRRKERT